MFGHRPGTCLSRCVPTTSDRRDEWRGTERRQGLCRGTTDTLDSTIEGPSRQQPAADCMQRLVQCSGEKGEGRHVTVLCERRRSRHSLVRVCPDIPQTATEVTPQTVMLCEPCMLRRTTLCGRHVKRRWLVRCNAGAAQASTHKEDRYTRVMRVPPRRPLARKTRIDGDTTDTRRHADEDVRSQRGPRSDPDIVARSLQLHPRQASSAFLSF